MWHALRAELAYFRPWLLGGLGIAAGVAVLMTVLMHLPTVDSDAPSFLPAMFFIIAGMVVAFIAQSYRWEERRARLLMAGPLTPRQLAGVTVLLPACLVGLGVLAGGLWVGVTSLITGSLEPATLPTLGGFAGQFYTYAQMGPLAQEATAARRQRRGRAAIAGWAVFVGAIPFLAVSWFYFASIHGHLGQLIAAATVMVASTVLYEGRTDFTR
jgi:hypothetical protein